MRYATRAALAAITIAILTACGSSTPPPANVTPDPAPTASLRATTADPTVGSPVQFVATIEAHGRTFTLAWDFGDGTTRTDNSTTVTHTYTTPGTYTAQVTVTAGSNSASASHTVTVQAPTITDPDPDPTPDPTPEPSEPYNGHNHLGTWVWVAVTGTTENLGILEFDAYRGSPTAATRLMIEGEWMNCTFGACVTIGPAMMGEVSVSTGWEHSFAFYYVDGDIRALGFGLEYFEPESGDIGYTAIGEYYGATAVFGLIRADASTAATAELSANLADLSLTTLGVDRSEEIRQAFNQLSTE